MTKEGEVKVLKALIMKGSSMKVLVHLDVF